MRHQGACHGRVTQHGMAADNPKLRSRAIGAEAIPEPGSKRAPRWMTRNRKFGDWLGDHARAVSLWVCFLTALWVTFSLYPGWFFFDSAQQWQWARLIALNGLPVRLEDFGITSHWPIFNTLMDVPFYLLTGEAGLYILAQALLYNTALYLLGAAILGRKSAWLIVYTLVVVLSPISLNYSVFQSADMVVAICALVAIAMVVDNEIGTPRRVLLFALAMLVMSLCRYNALPAVFFLIGVFFWLLRDKLGSTRSFKLACLMALVVGGSVSAARTYEHTAFMRDSAAEGVSLRLLDASRYTTDPTVHALVDPYIQASPKLREPLTPECYAHGGWCAQMDGQPWRNLSTSQYMKAYLHLLVHHPFVFSRVIYNFSIYQLGLAAPLEATQIANARYIQPPFPSAAMTFNHRRMAFYSALLATLGALGSLAARAGIVCLLGLITALLLRRRSLVAAFVALAVGYLGPLLLLAGTNNFRYTFPVSIVAFGIAVAGCCMLVRHAADRVKQARRFGVVSGINRGESPG